ncbi:MAG: cell division protein FtsZ [Bacteroidales bacterium]|nr:cell division protein FtsZ [Bacteroidales bacterium]
MLTFDSPKDQSSIIKVLGVGGGGGNAVNHMHSMGIQGVDFILCNTDAQALEGSAIPTKIQLGNSLTEGRGAGSKPEVGRNAAIEDIEKIKEVLDSNTKMLFITAGMGGGTGTGAAPVIAQAASEMDILTVGIVTIPFGFEGRRRKQLAMNGIEEMKKYVDTILIISNDKLRELHGDLKLSEAFSKADNILTTAARGIAEIITVTGYVNVDFEDVKTVMKDSGVAIMGAGIAEGENRAMDAAEMALNSPLLNDNDIQGASNMLLYIASGNDNEIRMDEISEITDFIADQTGEQCEVIWGSGTDETLGNNISITLIATGFTKKENPRQKEVPIKNVTHLGDEPKSKTTTKPEIKVKTPTITEPTLIEKTETTEIGQSLFTANDTNPVTKSEQKEVSKPTLIIRAKEKEETFTISSEEKTTVKTAPSTSPQESEEKLSERAKKLRELSYRIPKNSSIDDMENIPAYKRKNIHISHTVVSKESDVARFSLSENDGTTEIKTNNSFLHDNVD